MPKYKKEIQEHYSAYGQVSTHPFRQMLIDHSLKFSQEKLNKYVIRYYQGFKYFNIILSKTVIHAYNKIEAHVIMHDYFNMVLKTSIASDQFESLYNIFEDDHDEYYDSDGNFIATEGCFYDDTVWLEDAGNKFGKTILKKTW